MVGKGNAEVVCGREPDNFKGRTRASRHGHRQHAASYNGVNRTWFDRRWLRCVEVASKPIKDLRQCAPEIRYRWQHRQLMAKVLRLRQAGLTISEIGSLARAAPQQVYRILSRPR